MAVRPRGGGYQADVSDGVKRHRYLFKTESEATGWEADAKAAIANGRPVPAPNAIVHGVKPGSISLERACELCWAEEYAHIASAWPKTVKLYFAAMQKFFGVGATLEEIASPERVAEFTKHLYESGNAQGTVNAKLSVLSKLLNWAIEKRYIKEKPKLKRRKVNNARLSYLSYEDEATILRLLRQWEYHDEADAVAVLIDTGMRSSELFRLTGKDAVDLGDKKQMPITIWQTKGGETPTRRIYATTRVRDILRRRKTAYGDGKLFPTLNNWRMIRVWNRAKSVMGKDDDKEFVVYLCRHTCASRMVQRGVPLGVIQKWMGHKNIQMTMRYAKNAPADFEAAALALDQARPAEIVQFPTKETAS
jgi:integrase